MRQILTIHHTKIKQMRKCIVTFFKDKKGEVRWQCESPLFLQATTHPISQEKCYHYKCSGRQAFTPEAQNALENPKPEVCVWKDCDKPKAPNKLRHCSEECRLRHNRYNYIQRKKNEVEWKVLRNV